MHWCKKIHECKKYKGFILQSENRQFEVRENKHLCSCPDLGCESFLLIYVHGYLAVPQIEINRNGSFPFMIHIGNIIKCELASQGRSVHWLADKLCTDRTNMYRILKKSNLDTDLIRRISIHLNHDFFQDLSDSIRNSLK